MTERPTDDQIAAYINDLETALADEGAILTTSSDIFAAVHPWAAQLVHGDDGAELVAEVEEWEVDMVDEGPPGDGGIAVDGVSVQLNPEEGT